jgi:hypothetical protein
MRGFGAWLVDVGDGRHARRSECGYGFAAELGTHYRMEWLRPSPAERSS